MDITQTRLSINDANVKALDVTALNKFKLSEAPEDLYNRVLEAQKSFLEHRYTEHPDLSDNPAYQNYATIEVNGKVVAEIDNHGFTKTSNALGNKLGDLFSDGENGLSGPKLAQYRAEKIAELLGGDIVKSSTALTQTQFNAVPEPERIIDYEAMSHDPMYTQLEKLEEARTMFLAQQYSSMDIGDNAADTINKVSTEHASAAYNANNATDDIYEPQNTNSTNSDISQAKADFLDYMSKTPEERYYEALLAEKGLTQEELDAMPLEERLKIEEQIKEEIKKRITEKAGTAAASQSVSI